VWGSTAPVGIPAERLTGLLASIAGQVRLERLSGDPSLWGKAVTDERYAVLAQVRTSGQERGEVTAAGE
jgi:hypothetical protein